MRSTIIKGVSDNLYANLGSNVDIIGAVIEKGKATDYLIYELELDGAELLEFLAKFRAGDDFAADINLENRYVLISYDW